MCLPSFRLTSGIEPVEFSGPSFNFSLKDRDTCPSFRQSPFQFLSLGFRVGVSPCPVSFLFLLLFPSQRAHEHLAAGGVDVGQRDSAATQLQLAYLVGMSHAARFDDGQGAVALAGSNHVREMDPRVRDRGDAGGAGLLTGIGAFEKRGNHNGGPARLREIEHPLRGIGRPVPECATEGGDRVHDEVFRAVLDHPHSDASEVLVGAVRPRVNGLQAEQSARDVRRQVNAHRRHIAEDLRRRFVEAHIERPFVAAAGGERECRAERGLGRPRRA